MSIFGKIKGLFLKADALPEDIITNLEEILIEADVSLTLISKIITKDLQSLKSLEEVKKKISASMLSILKPKERKLKIDEENKPFVIFVVGVNGGGKTTSIGKLANKFTAEGKKVLIGACDTFRAGAVMQIEHFANITGAEIEKPLKEEEDPASTVYRSFTRAKAEEFDVLIIDTSGRLQNNKGLMDELAKMQKVLSKLEAGKPDLSLLVVDGSVGQAAILQSKEFSSAINIDGIILTKLDSSSKGGVVFSIANDFPFGIYFAATGEKIDDIEDFNSEKFIESIF